MHVGDGSNNYIDLDSKIVRNVDHFFSFVIAERLCVDTHQLVPSLLLLVIRSKSLYSAACIGVKFE